MHINAYIYAMLDLEDTMKLYCYPYIHHVNYLLLVLQVKSAHELCWRHNLPALDFGTLAELAFQNGPKKIRKFAGAARYSLIAISSF
jgi:hypothetical protein